MELVKGELAWPETNCEACNYNLREATPKAAEKSNDEAKRLKWTDFCPRCGKGMFVGDRLEPLPPAEVLAERETQAILKVKAIESGLADLDPEHQVSPGEPFSGEASGILPDQRGKQLAEETDPERQLSDESPASSPPEHFEGPQTGGPPEPGAIIGPSEGQYFCTKCASNHNEKSGIGKRHSKNREA